jgi:hypothetical protein
MNKHINKRKPTPKKKITLTVPFGGNRHAKRANIAIERLKPEFDRIAKINRNIKETKEIGRKAKQKHIDEVRAKTIKRKSELKTNKK